MYKDEYGNINGADEITCPFCGYEESDRWEYNQEGKKAWDHECNGCGKTFRVVFDVYNQSNGYECNKICKNHSYIFSKDYMSIKKIRNKKMNESTYKSLNKKQQELISDFMKDFIVSEISNQVKFFIKLNTSSDGAKKFIFEENNRFKNYIKDLGFPEDWEHKELIVKHQIGAVEDIEMYFEKGLPTESKKDNCRYLVYKMDELRIWFEEDLKGIYPEGNFTTIITNNGLIYKDDNIQNMWDGVLLFTKAHRQLIDPTTGGLF